VEIDGKKYHVSAAIGTVNEFNIETPVLQKGDGLIFSPYLIHGNGLNKQNDTTRVSLEFRFCKQ
jgi:ectoine hydroxylase-related dioxygenase (phytanoyl-CoA dioxygenase family)